MEIIKPLIVEVNSSAATCCFESDDSDFGISIAPLICHGLLNSTLRRFQKIIHSALFKLFILFDN